MSVAVNLRDGLIDLYLCTMATPSFEDLVLVTQHMASLKNPPPQNIPAAGRGHALLPSVPRDSPDLTGLREVTSDVCSPTDATKDGLWKQQPSRQAQHAPEHRRSRSSEGVRQLWARH